MFEKMTQIGFSLMLLCVSSTIPAATAAVSESRLLVIAHRGASGYRPEHTLAAYELAIDLGADYIEPDLVCTRDGVLVARHENEISTTTDVADRANFSDRKKKKEIDGKSIEGWFTEDFTLAELKSLRARERMPKVRQHNTIYDGRYSIPTFQEVLDLVKKKSAEKGKQIGIYPEAKHPSYFAGIGLDNEKALIEALHTRGYESASSPVYIQCFEVAPLKRLRQMTKLRLVQLIDTEGQPYDFTAAKIATTYADMVKPEGLAEIAKYADGIGPGKNMLIPRDKQGNLQAATSLVADAHKVGLVVHPWTFRNENEFLPTNLRKAEQAVRSGNYGDAFSEYEVFYKLGVDGVFSENPDTAIEARPPLLKR